MKMGYHSYVTATGAVKGIQATVHSLTIVPSANAGTISLYNAESATGTPVFTCTTSAAGVPYTIHLPAALLFRTALYAELTDVTGVHINYS